MSFVVTNVTAPAIGVSGRQPISTGLLTTRRTIVSNTVYPIVAPDDPGSPFPLAFHVQNNICHLQLTGTFPFPQPWSAPGSQYRVTGGIAGQFQIESALFPVPNPVDPRVTVAQFTFVAWNMPRAPFVCGGAWTWTINHIPLQGPPVVPSVVSDVQTRIEAYFFLGSMIFPGGVHCAELLRIIVADLPTVNAIGVDPVSWYARHLTNNMWAYGGPAGPGHGSLGYDCYWFRGGRSHFFGFRNQQYVFRLGEFLSRTLSKCNCYDLACAIQTCCMALGKRPNPAIAQAELTFIPTTYCRAIPFGYVPSGPLFGWPALLAVNSPFWRAYFPRASRPSHFVNLADPARSRFSSHAFISFPNQAGNQAVVRRILDITHGLQDPINPLVFALENGQHDLGQFLWAAIDRAGFNAPQYPPNVYTGFYDFGGAWRPYGVGYLEF